MGLDTLVRGTVATANRVTSSLQVTVMHRAWIGRDVNTKPRYGDPIARKALVERKQRWFRSPSGENVQSRTYIAFLEPIPANGADTRQEPIDGRDVLTLPDGTTGPILDVSGFMDPGTGAPYYAEVYLG
jgi:hypothetical protein